MYNTSKHKTIAKKCLMASGYSARKKSYSIIADWAETSPGTSDYDIRITLKSGYSFDEFEMISVSHFDTVNKAMNAIKNQTFKLEKTIEPVCRG